MVSKLQTSSKSSFKQLPKHFSNNLKFSNDFQNKFQCTSNYTQVDISRGRGVWGRGEDWWGPVGSPLVYPVFIFKQCSKQFPKRISAGHVPAYVGYSIVSHIPLGLCSLPGYIYILVLQDFAEVEVAVEPRSSHPCRGRAILPRCRGRAILYSSHVSPRILFHCMLLCCLSLL